MYQATAATGTAATTLAFTGFESMWLLSAAMTMLFAGLALKSILPAARRKRAARQR